MLLKLSDVFKLDNVAMYEPNKIDVSTIPIFHEDSGLDSNYGDHSLLLGYKRNVTLTYDVSLGNEISVLLNSLSTNAVYHNLTYRDPKLGIHTLQVKIDIMSTNAVDYRISNETEKGIFTSFSAVFYGTKLTQF